MEMDMGHTHGGDMSMGTDVNYAYARDYWYIIAGVVTSLVVVRGINHIGAIQRLKACNDPSIPHPTRPNSLPSQLWATATALVREISHPQFYVPIRGLRWATPPPLGRVLTMFSYWAMIIYFMTYNAVTHDAYFYERIAYRNAWVSIAQLPFLYLLSMKVNVLAWLIGSSHERLNWLHRWVARTMFVTATVHGFHFWTEWVKADLLQDELEIMPLVKYGLGAWSILLWSVVVGFFPLRRLAYEAWVLQHVVSAVVMLWLLYKHIPVNAQYMLWTAISFLVFDRAARWVILLWQNVRFKASSSSCQGSQYIGHRITAKTVGESTTVLTIKDVHFKWTAGQHVYLWIPRLGPLEAHPYTIACAHQLKGTCCCNSIQLIVRSHKGFSKRIHEFASKNSEGSLTGFLSGPYGAPPRLDIYETMVLIGASTGASFTVPILESVAHADKKTCAKRIEVVLMAKTASEIEYYVQRAKESARAAKEKGIEVMLHVAITGQGQGQSNMKLAQLQTDSDSSSISGPEKHTSRNEKHADYQVDVHSRRVPTSFSSSSSSSMGGLTELVREYNVRPDIEALIREPVEQAWGETAVVVCGGREVVARTRNCVSGLSDERAVHKGTGAQGIYLHVEEYSF